MLNPHIKLTASDGHSFDAYVAEPTTPATSAVVVVQEIFGVNRHIRSVVDGYASEGFLALAPALFDRVQPGIELEYNSADTARGMKFAAQIGMDKPLLDVAASINHLAERVPVKKVGLIGFCYGGTLAWRSASRLKLSAAVGYYGGRVSHYVSEQPRCPVMLHFGALDKHIPSSEIEKIQRAHLGLPIFLYPNAGHGFNCDERADYNLSAATLARERTLAFLRSHLN
jgi:carboxymethylenebutenolidase